MDEDKEERRGFRVTDRRRFAESGEARPEEVEPSATPSQAEKVATAAVPEAPPEATALGAEEPVTFSTFVLGLSTQALLHLGEIPDLLTRAVERDLVAARQVIDILGILREKTQNNLEPGEAALLDSILYDLRMRFVELTRPGTREGT